MRYQVVQESVSGHCCFEASVIDTERPSAGASAQMVCECFDISDAEMIAAALNATKKQEQPR